MVRVQITAASKISARNRVLYQVELLVDIDAEHLSGSLGGWVESIDNIKNPETGDIEGVVLDNAELFDNARVYDSAILKGDAQVGDNATIRGNAVVGGKVRLNDFVVVEDDAVLGGEMKALGRSRFYNDVNFYNCYTFKNESLNYTPFQIQGTKHPVMYFKELMYIGCIKGKMPLFVSTISQMGIDNGYSPGEITEYIGHMNTIKDRYRL